MDPKDLYKTLGVSETASADEIKKSYRRLAKKYHPDVNQGDKAKEAKFKEISQAYDVLGDPKKRTEYDNARKNPFAGFSGGGGGGGGFPGGGFPGGGGPGGGRMHIDLDELFGGRFSSIFGEQFNEGMGGAGGTKRGGQPRKGTDLQTSLEISLPEAALGVEKHVVLEGSRRLTVRIPAGLEDGETIRVPGQGRPGQKSGPPGDLLVQIHVPEHPVFRRKGADIEVDVPVQIDEAVLGAKVEVTTMEGKAQVTVPAGTSSGQRLRLRGKGASDRKGGRGDLYGVILIQVPKKIPEEARPLIEQFAKLVRSA